MEVYILLLRTATSRRYQGQELAWLRGIAEKGDEENRYLRMMELGVARGTALRINW